MHWKDSLQTLNDFQQPLGDIQWLSTNSKFPMGDLEPLNEILKENIDPSSPMHLADTLDRYWDR